MTLYMPPALIEGATECPQDVFVDVPQAKKIYIWASGKVVKGELSLSVNITVGYMQLQVGRTQP